MRLEMIWLTALSAGRGDCFAAAATFAIVRDPILVVDQVSDQIDQPVQCFVLVDRLAAALQRHVNIVQDLQ